MATKKKSAKSIKLSKIGENIPKDAVVCPECGLAIWVLVNDAGGHAMLLESGPDCNVPKVRIRSIRPQKCACGYSPAVFGPRKQRNKWAITR